LPRIYSFLLFGLELSHQKSALLCIETDSTRFVSLPQNDDDTFGELDFEEDWADDEERMEGDNALDEEEAKELEDKVKREMAKAERSSDDEDEEENEDDQVNGTKKQLKKMMKALGKATGNDAYESDEDKNPYLSVSFMIVVRNENGGASADQNLFFLSFSFLGI